jgi:protoporphyrinogen oxidase
MAEIVILGAGLTGLSAAYHLEKQGFFDYKMFEKDSTVGGLCRSVTQDGFTFDYTGHLLHINDSYFKQFIEQLIGLEQFNVIQRRSFIYSHDTYTHYPYQINLYGLPPEIISECIEGFVNRKKNRAQNLNFQQWVLINFGAGLGKNFFFPYQEKIFDFDVQKLSASWTGRFVPQTSLHEMLLGALRPPETTVGYNAQFFYPKIGGIQFWIKKMADKIIQPIMTGYEVTKIDSQHKLVYFANGHVEPYKKLITTLPLDFFLKRLQERSHTTLFRASEKLLCNSVINFNIGVDRPNLSSKHWVYYPEKQYPFYRIGFPHNFAASMAPEGQSSLYGECSHLGRSPAEINQLVNASRDTVYKLFAIRKEEIATEKIITIPHAYVIFDRWRDRHINHIHEQLAAYHIYSVGRYGAWKYSSMQEGLLDGKYIAEMIIEPIESAPLMAAQKIKSVSL